MQYAATYFTFSASVSLPARIRNKIVIIPGEFLDADGDEPLQMFKTNGFDIYYAPSDQTLKTHNTPGRSTLHVEHQGVLYRIGTEDTEHFARFLAQVQEHSYSIHLQIHTLAAKFQESEAAFISAVAAERERRDLAQIEEAARKLEAKEAEERAAIAAEAATAQEQAERFKAGDYILAEAFALLLRHLDLWPAIHPRTKAYIQRTLYSVNNTGHYQYYQHNGRKAESAGIRPLVTQLAAKLAA